MCWFFEISHEACLSKPDKRGYRVSKMVSSFSVSSMHSSEEEIWKVQLSCLSSLEQKIDEKVQLFSLLYFFFRDTTV